MILVTNHEGDPNDHARDICTIYHVGYDPKFPQNKQKLCIASKRLTERVLRNLTKVESHDPRYPITGYYQKA